MSKERALLLEIMLLLERYPVETIRNALFQINSEAANDLQSLLETIGKRRRPTAASSDHRLRGRSKGAGSESSMTPEERSLAQEVTARMAHLPLRSVIDTARTLGVTIGSKRTRSQVAETVAKAMLRSGQPVEPTLARLFGKERSSRGFAELAQELIRPSDRRGKKE
jgi:hypothetical protein